MSIFSFGLLFAFGFQFMICSLLSVCIFNSYFSVWSPISIAEIFQYVRMETIRKNVMQRSFAALVRLNRTKRRLFSGCEFLSVQTMNRPNRIGRLWFRFLDSVATRLASVFPPLRPKAPYWAWAQISTSLRSTAFLNKQQIFSDIGLVFISAKV